MKTLRGGVRIGVGRDGPDEVPEAVAPAEALQPGGIAGDKRADAQGARLEIDSARAC